MMRTSLVTVTLSVFVLAFVANNTYSQSVGISNTTFTPDAQSILEIQSTSKGVLLPRVSSAQRTAIAPTPGSDFGLMVYDTDTDSYWYWDGALWQELPNVSNTGNTLDEAYDEGGPGAGRVINATNGNVEITGAGFLTVASNVGIGTTGPDRRMKISGAGWTALEVENTDNQDAAIELTSQSVSNYVFTDNTGFLGVESAAGQPIVLRTDGANERVVVQADGRLRVNNLADPNFAVVLSSNVGVLGKVALTGNATDVLLGNGTFGPSSAFADDDWYQTLSTNTPTSINDWIYTNGRVGIGVGASSNPSAPLHVSASGAGNPDGNSILASNPTNAVSQDAIITARVAGSSSGDPFFSMDISGEAGWSMGVDNDHANRFKIAPSWSNLSSSTALTIQTDGNVGVGTTGPTEKLTVSGTNTDTYPALGLRSGNDNTGINNGAQIAFGYNGANQYQHFIQTRHNSANTQNAIDFYVSNGTAANTLTSGSVHTMSLVSGNVGVGTTAPASALHVSTTQVGNVLKVHNPTLANGSLVGQEFGKANSTNNMAEFRYNHISDGNAGNWVNLGLWGNANTLNVVGTGNVGIGTTGPAQKLEVAGNTRITGLGGGGDRVVYTNTNGDLYASTGIPASDADYIWNQSGVDQGASFRVNGSGSANVYYVNHGSGNVLEVGDDAWIGDINSGNMVGIYGQQNAAHGGLRLGNNGGAYLYSDGTANIGIGTTTPGFKLQVNGDINPIGFLVVQNSTDGGNTRGIRMWTQSDSNWGIYMGQSGAGKSFSGGTATAGGGFAEHALRFRVAASTTQGFIFENGSEQNLLSIRGNNGRATFRGGIQLDCVGCGSTSSIDGDGSSNWGTLTLQGRVLSSSDNLHLSPPNGARVIINTAYRAAGGTAGTSGLTVDGTVRFGGSDLNEAYRGTTAAGRTFDGSNGVILENRESESGGFFANGNTAAIWSPGDNVGILSIHDEDDINNPRVVVNPSGVVEARYGMQTERHIRFYKRSRGNGQGGVDNLGNYDFCYLAGVAFRNSDSVSDEDDDYQCNVYSQDINGSADYNEGENEDYSANFGYNSRPYWRLYSECYQDCSNSTCTAICINFDY